MTIPSSFFVDFSKPFIDAAKNIFETMVYTKISTLKPSFKKDKNALGDISAIIAMVGHRSFEGINSDFKGQFLISFPEITYIKIANAMLSEDFTKFDDEIIDVGEEICNMIMGNAKQKLKDLGFSFEMSIPTTVQGSNHKISYPRSDLIVVIPVTSDHGEFFFEICYQE